MNCARCGALMRTNRENYLYRESGLTYVTLVGVEVGRCPRCGEHEAVIPKIEQLHSAIATAIARKVPRLVSEEVRFLRKHLGWSGGEFAAHLGVSRETVSRWETGAAAMGPVAERLLRLAALTHDGAAVESLSVLKQIARENPSAGSVHVALRRGAWSVRAA
jgi:putative zinc finger/helix-turn-helix YgiT family protein